jgi:hypothetical protein
MSDFPSFARMPGSDSAVGSDDFEPTVISGLRTSGIILLITAAVDLLSGFAAASLYAGAIVNSILGVQLLRLKHSWKLWALIRAFVGIAGALVAAVLAASSLVWIAAAATLAYCGALILLLMGVPSPRAILGGRLLFAVSVGLSLVTWWMAGIVPEVDLE